MSTMLEPPTTKRQKKSERVRDALLRYWRTSSDRAIADEVGVSSRTVSLCRKRLVAEGRILPRAESTQDIEACQYEVCTELIRPAPLNDRLYAPVDRDGDSFTTLVDDIREKGLLEPIVVSADAYILSGHRRYAAIQEIGFTRIKVRITPDVSYERDRDRFLQLLASHNRQRVKTTAEQLREELALMPEDSWHELQEYRKEASSIDESNSVDLGYRKARSRIRDKLELKDAIMKIVHDEEPNWPLSDRAIHYRLLNVKDLVRNDKTRTPYENTLASYNDVTNMLTRMRIDGSIPFDAIADETPRGNQWQADQCVGDFIRRESIAAHCRTVPHPDHERPGLLVASSQKSDG